MQTPKVGVGPKPKSPILFCAIWRKLFACDMKKNKRKRLREKQPTPGCLL